MEKIKKELRKLIIDLENLINKNLINEKETGEKTKTCKHGCCMIYNHNKIFTACGIDQVLTHTSPYPAQYILLTKCNCQIILAEQPYIYTPKF